MHRMANVLYKDIYRNGVYEYDVALCLLRYQLIIQNASASRQSYIL